jgi:hypothetical protein
MPKNKKGRKPKLSCCAFMKRYLALLALKKMQIKTTVEPNDSLQ